MLQTVSAMAVIAIVTSLLKPFLEVVLPPHSALHDGAIRLLAILLGIGGAVINAGLAAHTLSPAATWDACGQGLLNGVAAIATYHLVSGNYFQEKLPGQQ